MATVQWRPEVNALTTPQSWRPLHLPRSTSGNNDLAARIAQKHSALDEEIVKTTLSALVEEIKLDLINGNQSALEDAFTFRISLNGRLNSPDDPLPPIEEVLNIRVIVARALLEEVGRLVQLERLAVSEKLPVIANTEDTVWKLKDVINLGGALRLTGTDLFFNPEDEGCECVLEGTHNGRAVQNRFIHIYNADITFLPDIPTQTSAWNNEYILSVSTHYTENGTLRTGVYRRRLRTPLAVTLGNSTGILSGSEASPLVTVIGGAFSIGNSTQVRIQVQVGLDGNLRFSLLDMRENGSVGPEVLVAGEGDYTLTGYPGSLLASLNVTVNNYAALLKIVKNPYGGRLVDILEVSAGA